MIERFDCYWIVLASFSFQNFFSIWDVDSLELKWVEKEIWAKGEVQSGSSRNLNCIYVLAKIPNQLMTSTCPEPLNDLHMYAIFPGEVWVGNLPKLFSIQLKYQEEALAGGRKFWDENDWEIACSLESICSYVVARKTFAFFAC